MNVADSSRAASALERLGYEYSPRADDADVIVLNTCVVRQSAEDKAYGRLQSLTPLKKKNPDLVINLMGCLVGVRGGSQRFRERFPQVDVFSPPSDFGPLLDFLTRREGKHQVEEETSLRDALLDEELSLPTYERDRLVSGYLSVVLGCSHACTYCVIPSRRGRERSRPPQEILREARSLAQQGVKEITLLGQIVDRYGKDQPDYPTLSGLLHMLHGVESLERLRFLTSHPNWMTDELLKTVADLPRVMPHIEVPVQSGDDQVLERMRRGYSAGQYRDLVAHIRACIPGVSIGTDIIVGFPGESNEQFQNTADLLRDLRLDVVHLARYSPRPGTVAATRMLDDVPDEVKWERFRVLEEQQEGISAQIHAGSLGAVVQVLFEEQHKGRWKGRTPTNKIVFSESEADLRGRTRQVRINWSGPWSLRGELVGQES